MAKVTRTLSKSMAVWSEGGDRKIPSAPGLPCLPGKRSSHWAEGVGGRGSRGLRLEFPPRALCLPAGQAQTGGFMGRREKVPEKMPEPLRE